MAQHDIGEAKTTYESFISTTKVSAAIIAVITIFVVLIIS
jgi:Bacterial aa3 type cytochrome c oxidase subunit IV